MDREAYLGFVSRDGTALAAAARAGLDAACPSCPGWTVRDIVHHTGMIHRWVAEMVRTGATTRLSRRDMPPPPSADGDVVPWFEEGAAAVVDTLRGADPEMPVWNWSTSRPHVAAFWPRRMAHETAVHRWDAERSHGEASGLDPALAVDGVDEMLDTVLPTLVANGVGSELGGTLHLHCTDVEGEWLVVLEGGRLDVRHEHGKGDAAVRGASSDLALYLWGRLPAEAVDTFGDEAVLAGWREMLSRF